MKTVTIPFDLELAKKIQNGEVEGEIVDKRGINYEIVKWDASGSHSLICTNFNKQRNITTACTYTFEGKYVGKNKESDFDLQLEVPEYLTISENNTKFVFIFKLYKSDDKYQVKYHAMYNTISKTLYKDSELMVKEGDNIYPSTPSEIAMLTDALLKVGKAWNPETKQIENVEKKPEHEFKPFDKVLVKDSDTDIWICDIFSHMDDDDAFYCVRGIWNYCIPYEGNEHLVGKTGHSEEHED